MATVRSNIEVMSNEEVITTYSIVDTDNFGGDYPNERFVCTGINYERNAEEIADHLNRHKDNPRYYRVVRHVEVRYKLQPGFEP
jgi:hypothetical protein